MTDPHPADLRIEVVRLDPELPLPSYAHPGDAGADLTAAAHDPDERDALHMRIDDALAGGEPVPVRPDDDGVIVGAEGRHLADASSLAASDTGSRRAITLPAS